MDRHHHLALVTVEFLVNDVKYRRLVRSLIYLSFTRLDFAYTVHMLAQFMQAPRQDVTPRQFFIFQNTFSIYNLENYQSNIVRVITYRFIQNFATENNSK